MKNTFRIIPSFPEFVSKWKTAQSLDRAVITPSMFLASEDECLLQEAVGELTDELLKRNAVPTTGTVPCINLSLRRQRHFAEEFHRMYTTLKNHAGFCNDFKGIVAVDLTDWASCGMDEDLEAVLSYLKDTQHDRFYIFYATTSEPDKLRNILQFYFTVQPHFLKLEKASELLSYAVSKLRSEYSIRLDNQAEASLGQVIRAVVKAGGYRGIGSVSSMCRDLSYQLLSEGSRTMDSAFIANYKQSAIHTERKPTKPVVGLIK